MSENQSSWKTPLLSMKLLAVLLIGLLLISIYIRSDSRNPYLQPRLKSNMDLNAPNSSRITEFKNKAINLDLDLKNKPFTLICFWATWCPNCKSELKAISEKFKKDNLTQIDLIAVNVNPENEFKLVNKFWQDLNINNIRLIHNSSKHLLKSLDIEVLPTYVLIQDKTKYLLRIDGSTNWNDPTLNKILPFK